MTYSRMKSAFIGFAALLLASTIWAQESDAPNLATAKAEPAEMAPLAAQGLLLKIAATGKHFIAVGQHGDIVVSNDGYNWAQVEAPVRSTLTSVSFPDPDHGWAVGHDAAIIKSSDAGRTWKLVHFDPEKQQPLLDVLFVDDDHGYAVGAFGLFLVTEDGGTTWSELDAPSIRSDGMHFYGIVKLGDGELFVAGEDGMLGVSRDGQTWDRLKSPYVGSFFGAIPAGQKGAVIYGLRGNVYRTADVRSPDWKKIDIGSVQSVFGATALDDGGIALVGADGLTIYLGADGSVDTKRFSRVSGEPGGGSLTSGIQWKQKLISTGESGIERRSIGR